MTNLDLIAAIEAAESQDLEHSERSVFVRRRRIGARLLIAAAVIALLSTSVFAVPAIRNALFGAKTRQICISRIYVKDGKLAGLSESSADVSLELRRDPAAPAALERFYAPMLPAEQWKPIPIKITEGSEASYRSEFGDLLQWENENGDYVLFRQDVCPEYSDDCAWDSVCTGYDAAYTVSQAELGGYTVQRIVVEPSEKEKDGFRAEHPGLQKLYWSDGFYVFSMEVNYSMSDETLSAILDSIRQVPDVSDLVVIERVPVPDNPQKSLRLDRVMYPETLPLRFEERFGGKQPNGGFLFSWLQREPFLSLVLEIEPDLLFEDTRYLWEAYYIPDEATEWEIGGSQVLGWQNGFRAQIVWRFDGADYSLKCSGEEHLSMEELLQIMQELVPVEDIDSLLTR